MRGFINMINNVKADARTAGMPQGYSCYIHIFKTKRAAVDIP